MAESVFRWQSFVVESKFSVVGVVVSHPRLAVEYRRVSCIGSRESLVELIDSLLEARHDVPHLDVFSVLLDVEVVHESDQVVCFFIFEFFSLVRGVGPLRL